MLRRVWVTKYIAVEKSLVLQYNGALVSSDCKQKCRKLRVYNTEKKNIDVVQLSSVVEYRQP